MDWHFQDCEKKAALVLSGISSLDQLRENLKTWETDEPLSEEELDVLVKLADVESGLASVPCTACHYCVSHCPQVLPIPDLLALYNEHKLTGGRLHCSHGGGR